MNATIIKSIIPAKILISFELVAEKIATQPKKAEIKYKTMVVFGIDNPLFTS